MAAKKSAAKKPEPKKKSGGVYSIINRNERKMLKELGYEITPVKPKK